MPRKSILDNISIVLVNTKTPGNIGATARCMMNMGLSRLILVRPPQDENNEAMKLAAGAEKIIGTAMVFPTLKEAVADHGLVVGTTRHASRRRKNIRTPREMAGQIIPLLSGNRVAIVFGREVNGLDKEDFALCHELIVIPSSGAFPSLNLSHAVMIAAYELFLAAHSSISSLDERVLAPAEELENFYRHLQMTLEDIGFIGKENKNQMMFSLRQIFSRAQLDQRDVNILRGVLGRMERAVKQGQTP